MATPFVCLKKLSPNEKQLSVSTSSPKQSNISDLGSLTGRRSKKMFEGQKTFGIRNDSIKRCEVHSEKKFVLTKEIKVVKKFEERVGCL